MFIKKDKSGKYIPVSEGKEIKKLYTSAGLTPPEGKGIHKKEFHKLAIKVAKQYIDKGMDKKKAMTYGYATAMKVLGKERSINKPHIRENVMRVRKDENGEYSSLNEGHLEDAILEDYLSLTMKSKYAKAMSHKETVYHLAKRYGLTVKKIEDIVGE